MKTFADDLSYYNNHDFTGMIEAIAKFLTIENWKSRGKRLLFQ